MLRPLPETLFAKWHRGDKYFDTDGRRIETWHDVDHESRDNSDGDEARSDDGDEARSDDGDEERSDVGDATVSIHSVPLASEKPFDSLEERLRNSRLEDIGEAEEKMILQLIHWILQYDPLRRPSATEILEHPWFSS